MINTTNLAIAETLAVSTDKDITPRLSPVVIALNDQLGGALPITSDNYRAVVTQNSATNGDYLNTFENVTDILSEKVRTIFDQIRAYAKPFATLLEERLYPVFDNNFCGSLNNFLSDDLELEFVKTDHPFFSSLYYPTAKSNPSLSFADYRKTNFPKVKFARWDSRKIIDWLDIDNPEIKKLLMSSNVDLTDALSSMSNFYSLPFAVDYEKESIDFTQPRITRMDTIFVQYIFLAKMAKTDEPFEGLTAGSLEAYRALVGTLFDAYTEALIELKVAASTLAGSPLRVVELTDGSIREVAPVAGVRPFKRVKAKANVFYNTTGVDMCVESKITMSEIVTAYFWTKYVGLNGAEARGYFADFSSARKGYNNIVNALNEVVGKERSSVLNDAIRKAIIHFVDHSPELDEVVKTVYAGSIDALLAKVLTGNFGDTINYWVVRENKHVSVAIEECGLVNNFLEGIGCKDASQILREVGVHSHHTATEVDQRKVLHVAVINYLVNMLFTNK